MPESLFLLCQFHCTFYFVIAVTGLYIFPQIFIKGEFVGGSDITLSMHLVYAEITVIIRVTLHYVIL
jgi:hypothetical protein